VSQAAVRHPGELRWETRLLAVLAVTLTVFGIASLYSASSLRDGGLAFARNQLIGALAGGIAMVVVSRLDYAHWRRFAWPVLGATVALLLIPLLPFTQEIAPVRNGARRWIELFGVQFQPSEIARFAVVLWAAALAAKKGAQVREFQKGVLPFLLVIGLVALMILGQPSLSMAIMVVLLGGVVLFAAGARIGQFLLLGIAAALIVVQNVLGTGFRAARVQAFFDPGASLGGAAFQADQSLIGLGSGGLFGVGFGQGQQKLNYLPYAYSDFLFSAIGEEWGFLGATVVILAFGVFCWVGFRIARTARDPFGQFLAAGLTAGIGFTALLHIAVTLRLMPTTGLPLPFMSYGRSNLVMTLFSVGVLVSIGRMRGRGPGPVPAPGNRP
jgi:cell division protein FtsW